MKKSLASVRDEIWHTNVLLDVKKSRKKCSIVVLDLALALGYF